MQNNINTTLSNITYPYSLCNIDDEQLYKYSILIIASICSFVGNLMVILIVYRNKNLRTSTNYFIVNMSVSDILSPLFVLIDNKFLFSKVSHRWLFPFFISVCFGVSMLTLLVITILRFSAVVFPLRARVQNKRKRLLVLLLTWVLPIAMSSPYLIYRKLSGERQRYFMIANNQRFRNWSTANVLLFFFLPLLIMLVLYPLIIIRLRKHKVPGNANFSDAGIRRAKLNFRLTIMFIVITVAFLLSWGPYVMIYLLFIWTNERWILLNIDPCIFAYTLFISLITPVVFHAINPVLYFIFCSSFRQGFKNIFQSSCCSKTKTRGTCRET